MKGKGWYLKNHPLLLIMDTHTLPTSIEIDGIEYTFDADYRNIIYIFTALNDPDLLDAEKVMVALNLFYDDFESIPKNKLEYAAKEMFAFMNMGEEHTSVKHNAKPLYDWEQDFNIIVAPINRILNTDVRGLQFLHWWTFLSAFYEIGECTFSTFVNIRNKLNKGKKLEKYEQTLYNENKERIVLKKKYDTVTQDLMNEILGV